MKRIFGAKKDKEPPPSLEEATDNLNKRGDVLNEKIRKLDAELLKHRETIRKLHPGPAQEAAKKRAMGVLRQKKLYEGQLEQLLNQQFNVDSAAFNMQAMKDNVQTVAALNAGAKEMQKMMKKHKELQVDEVYKTMDKMADLQADFEEIQDALGSYNTPIDVDESDLMGELDALGEEIAQEEAEGNVPAYLQDLDTAALPEAPTAGLPAVPAGSIAGAQPVAEDEFGLPARS